MTENKWILGVDLGADMVLLSCCQKNQENIIEARYECSGEPMETAALEKIRLFLEEQQLILAEGEKVVVSFQEFSPDWKNEVKNQLMKLGFVEEQIRIISRENAFARYVLHQEPSLYDHTVLLFDFDGRQLAGYRLENPKKKQPKRFLIEKSTLGIFEFAGENAEWGRLFDEQFAALARQLLSKEVVSAVFLTGKGFEGEWLSKSLNVICRGRRAFIGQNLFSGGCCYYGMDEEEKRDYMVCAPETVLYEAGVVDGGTGEAFVRVTEAGKAWYDTSGCIDVILERGTKVEVVFSNLLQMEKQVESIDVSSFPVRPRKTGRLRLEVKFLGSKKGLIFVHDLGFGAFSPGTHQVVMKEFTLL